MALTMNTRFPESDTISVSIDKKGDYTGSFLFRYPAWVDGEAVVLSMEKKRRRKPIKETIYVCCLRCRQETSSLWYSPGSYISTMQRMNLTLVLSCMARCCWPVDWVRRICRQTVFPIIGHAVNRYLPEISRCWLAHWLTWRVGLYVLHKVRCTLQLRMGVRQQDVELIPYFRMHHQRHTVYWKIYSPDEFTYRTRSLTDEVKIGDEKNEKKHLLWGENDSIYWHDFFWAKNRQYRMADGGWFSYVLHIDKKENEAI